MYSKDGRAYLVMQGDGNIVFYSTQVANLFGQGFASAIWYSATYGYTPGPFTLTMLQVMYAAVVHMLCLTCCPQPLHAQGSPISPSAAALQNCNLVATNGNGQIIYQSGTANKGTGACQLVVSGAGFAVIDSTGATIYSQGAYSTPGTTPGTLPANAVLTQVRLGLKACLHNQPLR